MAEPGPDPGQPTLTIDRLAAATGVPSRTIRLYQTKGVLPSPDRRGRVAYYGPAHVERLRLIGELQDRGLQLSAMRDLLRHGDGDVSVREWLGLGQQLTQPWSEDRPRTYTSQEIAGLLGDRAPGTLAGLVRTDVLQRQGEGALATYLAVSPGLLRAAIALDDAGVDIDTSAGAAGILRHRLGQAAAELVTFLVQRAGAGFGRDDSSEAIAAAFDGVRTTGGDAARLIFAAEVEQAVSKLVTRGTLPARKARSRRK